MKKPVLLLFVALFSHYVSGQEFLMTDGETVNTCSGVFADDGGGGSYGANSMTYTICPDSPGDVIQVDFVAFNMTFVNQNNADYLIIYDGPTEGSSPPFFYTGTDLQGLPVTASVNNASGCLTFVLQNGTGNSSNLPGWEGIISCTTPCDPPTSVNNYVDIPDAINGITTTACVGETIEFTGAGSAAGAGFTIDQYMWNFDYGVLDSLSGENASFTFEEPGEYLVSLTVFDNNGCASQNIEPLQILVSTIPAVDMEWEESVCFGETIDMSAIAEGVTWTSLPPQVVAGETYLADGAGFSYSSSLNFDFFEPDAVLENCDDLLDISVNMEHSYLGDLEINIECPNGTLITLLDFGANNGGGTFLGEAVDDGLTTTQGVGYDYGWAPDATNGFIYDNANASGGIANAGIYQSNEDMCDLVGCPLNGSWTFSVIDNLGADNGWIFEWGINFNPSLFPDITTFTPTVGQDIDSTWWTGPTGATVIDQGNQITFVPDAPGFYDFTFNTVNSFECEYDTTITVEITPVDDIEAWSDPNPECGEPLEIGMNFLGGSDPNDYDFEWIPGAGLVSAYSQNTHIIEVTGQMTLEAVAFIAGHPDCSSSDFITVSVANALILDPDTNVCGMEYTMNAVSTGVGLWTVPAGLNISGSGNPLNDPNATFTADAPGDYVITWTDTEGLSCPNTLDMNISFFDGIDITPTVTDAICNGDCNGEVVVTGSGGNTDTGDYEYWFPTIPDVALTNNSASGLCASSHTVFLTDNHGCQDSTSFTIGEPEVPVIDSVLFFREECKDFCNGWMDVISSQATQYSFDDGETYIPNGFKDDFCPGSYNVWIANDNGCIGGPTNVVIGSPQPPVASFTYEPIPPDVLNPTVTFINTSDFAVEHDWLFGIIEPLGSSTAENPVFTFPPELGDYPVMLTVTDSIGCQDSLVLDVHVNDVIMVFIPNTFTPNEDGLNDLFSPVGHDIDEDNYQFIVYTKWGDKVYESTTYPHTWNGSLYNEKEYYVPDGYYNWHLITKSKTTTEKLEMRGTVMVMR